MNLAFNIRHFDKSQYDRLLLTLDTTEQNRIKRFCFEDDRIRALVGRRLIRLVCDKYIGMGQYTLCRTNFGKPIIKENHNLYFNISHHGDWVVIVASKNGDVGVDVMRYEKKINIDHFKNVFTSKEMAKINTKTFFHYWTLKEAYVKAAGTGISFGLERLSFNISKQISLKIDDKLDHQFIYHIQELDQDHCVSICMPNMKPNFEFIKINDLFVI